MKRLALISYAWPPAGGAGVQRPLKWVKYLPEFGWQTLVLHPRRGTTPVADLSLAAEIPPGVIQRALPNLEPPRGGGGAGGGGGGLGWVLGAVNRLMFPDRQILWALAALPGALAAVRRHRPRALLVTAPPFSQYLLAWAVAARTGLPLVLDFRDEWSGFYQSGYDHTQAGWLGPRLTRALEGALVRRAARVTVASPAYAQRFRRLYGGPDHKYLWLPNGYDAADFAGPPPPPDPDPRTHLVYTGTIFAVTSLERLWAGLAALTPEQRRGFRVTVAGRQVAGQVTDPGLEGLEVAVTGYLPHGEVVALMRRAHGLVLTLDQRPGAHRVIPAKTYEYLAAGPPILALVPPGVTAALVESHQGGVVVGPDQGPEALARVLLGWRREPPGGHPAPPLWCSRRAQTARLAELLDQLPAPGEGGRP